MESDLSGREYAALLSMFGGVSTLLTNTPRLKARLTDEQNAAVKAATETLDSALGWILDTVPAKKLLRLKLELKNAALYVKIEPNGLLSQMPEPYTYIPVRAVNGLLMNIVRSECLLCGQTDVESRKCPYRTLIEDALPHAAGHERDDGMCRYADCAIEMEEPE